MPIPLCLCLAQLFLRTCDFLDKSIVPALTLSHLMVELLDFFLISLECELGDLQIVLSMTQLFRLPCLLPLELR